MNPALEKLRAIEVRRLRQQQQIVKLCRTPRLVAELVEELDRVHRLGADLDERLAKYAAANLGLLQTFGADKIPPPPLHRVR
jgi:hypothetical protein